MGLTAQSIDNDTQPSARLPQSTANCNNDVHIGALRVALAVIGGGGGRSDLCLSCPRLGDREGKDQGRLGGSPHSHSLRALFSRFVSVVPYLHGVQKISLFGSERVQKMTARYVENTHTQSRLKSAQSYYYCLDFCAASFEKCQSFLSSAVFIFGVSIPNNRCGPRSDCSLFIVMEQSEFA